MNNLQNKTILVTGGNGFIGKNVVDYFRGKTTVLSPTHKNLDLLDQEKVRDYLKDYSIDYVIHCASIGVNKYGGNGNGTVEKNIRMFFNLAENAKHFGKLITMGSGAEYDKRRSLHKVKEYSVGESIPVDGYGFSKYVISKYIEKSGNNVCLRLFGVFGKYEDPVNRFISQAIISNINREPIHIRQNAIFDYLYVNDLVKIIPYFFVNDYKYKVYNVTPGTPIDLVRIAGTVNSQSNFTSKIITDKPGFDNEYTGDNSRLLDKIGTFPFTPIEKAISELITYYQKVV